MAERHELVTRISRVGAAFHCFFFLPLLVHVRATDKGILQTKEFSGWNIIEDL
jgi:hypothetical protein